MQSYANAVISSFEDPEKILEQTVIEMNDDLTKMRQATAQVSFQFFKFIFAFPSTLLSWGGVGGFATFPFIYIFVTLLL